MTIAGGILTYNSEFWVRQSGSTLRHIVDFMTVAIDNMTSDRTSEVAEEIGANLIYRFTWKHDYAHAKNLLIDNINLNYNPDWIILLDDDEKFSYSGAVQLRRLITKIEEEKLPYDSIQVGQKQHYPIWSCDENDYIKEFYPNSHIQIFRNLPSHRFANRVHEGIHVDMSRLFPFEKTEQLGIMLHHHAWRGDRAKWEAPKHNYYKDLSEGKEFKEGEKTF